MTFVTDNAREQKRVAVCSGVGMEPPRYVAQVSLVWDPN